MFRKKITKSAPVTASVILMFKKKQKSAPVIASVIIVLKKQKSAPVRRRRQVWSQEPARRSRKPQLKKARQGGMFFLSENS